MSCYVVSDLTISAIVAAMADTDFEPASLKDEESGVKYNPATCGQIVGQMLLDANYASVNEYYGKPFTLGEKYGCIECYEYQACQQPGYDNSEIHGALDYAKDDLTRKMLKKLGEECVWGLE